MTAVGAIYGNSSAVVSVASPADVGPRLNHALRALTAEGVIHRLMVFDTTIDEASLLDGAGVTTSITGCAGVALGDFCLPAFGVDLAGITVTAYVKTAGEINVRVQNESGGTLDLASTNIGVLVFCRT